MDKRKLHSVKWDMIFKRNENWRFWGKILMQHKHIPLQWLYPTYGRTYALWDLKILLWEQLSKMVSKSRSTLEKPQNSGTIDGWDMEH